MTERIVLRGVLKGHSDWVTSIATNSEKPDMILSSSRDKTIIQWHLERDVEDPTQYGRAHKALRGHGHFVEDVVISRDGHFALSASWDSDLRLWTLETASSARRFVGHTKDILSVAFSADNRQIVSGGRDNSIRLWNTLGECKYTVEDAHGDWVSCVKFSPSAANPFIVSAGWDRLVKVWALGDEFKLVKTLEGHTGYVNSVAISPDGSLCASGGKDGTAILWDLKDGKMLYTFDGANSTINTLVFSPNHFWLCGGTDNGIIIWDLQSKQIVAELTKDMGSGDQAHPDFQAKTANPACLSLAWSSGAANSAILFAGYSDGIIRVWATSKDTK